MQRANFYKLFDKVKRLGSLTGRRSIVGTKNKPVYGDDVLAAKKNGLPIVALESTIITHGMPFPDNLRTAIRVENVVREKGAVPATIAILNGQVHIGLNQEQLEILSKADPVKTLKCSRRDISMIVSRKLNGGTTVSATMLLANFARIPIMATGGIGGVHREAESTFDISTDLIELGRTPTAVVCSGVKSILDIAKTLEYLETQGVPVVKIGETNHFPAFYCTETFDKLQAPYKVSTSGDAADLLKAQKELGLDTGILFAVPIPEKYALDPKEIETAICKALETAKSQNIIGKNVTPFLLQKLNEITRGRSLQANMALIENNATVAAEIAIKFTKKCQDTFTMTKNECSITPNKNPVVIGGAMMDTVLQIMESEIKEDGRTHAGRSRESCGGVGRNIANALISLGLNGTRLISVVGNDQPGKAIIKSLGDGGQTVVRLSDVSTARYTAIVDVKGECCYGIGETNIFAVISPDLVRKYQSQVEEASFIVLDGNLPLDTVRYILDVASNSKIPVWYEPTDVKKATKIFEAGPKWENVLHIVSPNKNELLAIAKHFDITVPTSNEIVDLETVKLITEQLAQIIPIVISTVGAQGVLVARKATEHDPFYDEEGRLIKKTDINCRHYPPIFDASKDLTETFNVSGCGDCLTAGILYGIHKGWVEEKCLSLALKAAALSLVSFDAVPATLPSLTNVAKY